MSDSDKFDILLVGIDNSLESILHPILKGMLTKHIKSAEGVENFLENYQLKPGSPVLVSNHLEGLTHNEIAQSFNTCYSNLKTVFVTMDRASFDIATLKKNGFTDSFIIPTDLKVLTSFIDECKRSMNGSGQKKYKQVKLVDIQPGENLPFEVRVYLPINNKYVLLTATGELSEKKHQALKTSNTGAVYVDENQMEQFYDFVADKLISLGQTTNDALSATEKAERLQNSVRTLFRSVLTVNNDDASFDSGRALMDQSKRIVENYVQKTTGLDLKGKLNDALGESEDSYSHAQSVSTLACLFSMGTGIGSPEDLAIAGLFHDIGVYGISKEATIFNWTELSQEEQKLFLQHPRLSLNNLKEKKITLTTEISEIIEKHHERIDATGFPSQLPAHKIPASAQLLAYADAFDYLLRPVPGKPKRTPLEIHTEIREKLGIAQEVLLKMEKFLKESL